MSTDHPTRREFLVGAGAVSAAVTLGLPGTASAAPSNSPRPAIPAAADLTETGPLQRRWLSVPHSRIVLNPLNFKAPLSPVEQSTAPDLPVGVGYFASDATFKHGRLLTVYERPDRDPPDSEPEAAWADEFTALDPNWHVEATLRTDIVDERLQLTVDQDGAVPWGAISQWLEIDLDAYPELRLVVPQAAGRWAVKVNDGTMPVDLLVKGEDTRTGLITVNLRETTPWQGVKRFRLRIFAVGRELPVLIDSVRIVAPVTFLRAASSFETAWRPHELVSSATYPGGTAVEVCDHFFDRDALLRSVRVRSAAGDGSRLSLTGLHDSPLRWDRRRRVLTVEREMYSFALALPRGAEPVFYASRQDLVAGGPVLAEPATSGAWELVLDPGEPHSFASVGFATSDEGGAATATSRAVHAQRGARAALGRQQRWWDQLLARVPHPLDFAVRGVVTHGVTAAQVRHAYYVSWVYTAANVLPPMPEAGYDYPQAPAGKPSLWMEGATMARASAMWESMFAIQFLAYVDPRAAWDAFIGFMSLTGDDGAIGGESLPVRMTQTATVLYQLTSDLDSLRAVYPAVKRHLLWSADNPRWIHGPHDFPDEKDAQFAFSALVEMVYAGELAALLGEDADVSMWQHKREAYAAECEHWFWASPTADPNLYYRADSDSRSAGNPLWISCGIYVEHWSDDSPYLAGLLRRFLGGYRPELGFAGFVNARYPDYDHTAYGLLDRGMAETATGIVNVNLRDVVRANMFAETYTANPPRGAGVRPSQNGASSVITAVWMNNGYRYDLGWPAVVRASEKGGGVLGLPIRGKHLDVVLEDGSSRVRLGGSLVRDTPQCRAVDVPVGDTVSIPLTCAK